MKSKRIAFIGGGNMARSLIGGLLSQGLLPSDISVAEPIIALRAALSSDFGVTVVEDNNKAVAGADVLVLAVKPQVMRSVCEALGAGVDLRNVLVVSIAAGVTVTQMNAWLGGEQAIVRVMPNTPALIGAGVCGIYANPTVTSIQKQIAADLLAATGEIVWLENELLMDAVTATSGSGPAYFFLLMEAMELAAVAQGLPEEAARALVLQTALGAARMALEGADSPAQLRAKVTSPGGTTQAALERFAQGGFVQLVDSAIAAATERGKQLSAQLESAE